MQVAFRTKGTRMKVTGVLQMRVPWHSRHLAHIDDRGRVDSHLLNDFSIVNISALLMP